MQSPKKVIVGSGPRMFREFLCSMFQAREDLDVVDKLFDGVDLVQSTTLHKPDLLILDLYLPRFNGISVLNAVRSRCARTKILVLTDDESEEHASEALQAGADGYCIKNTSTRELLEAVGNVMAGRIFVSPSIADGVQKKPLEGRKTDGAGNEWAQVTTREREVLKLLAEAHKNKEIAEVLGISPKTVEKHRSNIMSKLGLHTVADLTRYAHDRGLVRTGNPGAADTQARPTAIIMRAASSREGVAAGRSSPRKEIAGMAQRRNLDQG